MSSDFDARTCTNGIGQIYPKVNLQTLIQIMEGAEIYAMGYSISCNHFLPNNTVIISKDLAIKFGIWKESAESAIRKASQ
ncbi:MAG: hypothetical protein WC196_02925 [Bacilli bacterium]